jgi:tetratricopeptide (TPR) repeat protein
MKQPTRFAGIACVSIFILIAVLALALSPALAQETADDQAAKEEAKERAKQARIEEYLRKKEERRAKREMERAGKPVPDKTVEPVAVAIEAETEPAAKIEVTKPPKQKNAKAGKSKRDMVYMPRGLARVQESLREGDIGRDPTVRAYLDLIDRGEASPHQLAAFGNFLSQNGMTRDAMEYYGVALGMEQNDALLWMNVGTLHRQMQEFSMAANAYGKALSIDPNNAFAHYNLGSVLDEMGKYEEAIEEYKVALTLDPTLGDPAYNPQAANNEQLLAVKLMLYQEQTGALGLPLVELPEGSLEGAGELRSEPGR